MYNLHGCLLPVYKLLYNYRMVSSYNSIQPPLTILMPLQPPFPFDNQCFSIRWVCYSDAPLLLPLEDLCHESGTFGYRIRQSPFGSSIDVLCDSLPAYFVALWSEFGS